MAAGALLAAIVEQPSADVLADGIRAVEPDGIDGLDLDGAIAAPAPDAQQMPRDFRKPTALDRHALRPAARIAQHGVPIRLGQGIARLRRHGRPPRGLGAQFVYPFRCRHVPARGSVSHADR